MKFSFKKMRPFGQDEFIPPECTCSGPACGDDPPTCYPAIQSQGGIINGPGQPPGFQPNYGNQGYCGEDCGGCIVADGTHFTDNEFYNGGQYDNNLNGTDSGEIENYYDFNTGKECSPGETMYISGPLPCITITAAAGAEDPQPAVVQPRNFSENFSYNQLARYYQYYVGVFPIQAYSSLPINSGTTLRAAKIDVTIGQPFQFDKTRRRLMVLSAFNRYRYIGPLAVDCVPNLKWENLAPDTQGSEAANYNDFVGLSAGTDTPSYVANWRGDLNEDTAQRTVPLYGIIKLEKAIHGEFPHPDWKMQLPLFGGTAPADTPKDPPSPDCCPSGTPCYEVAECATPIPPYDEDLREGNGTPIGYFMHPFRNWSARPYNPDCHLGKVVKPGTTPDADPLVNGEYPCRRVHAPHCSLYSLFWAIRNYVFVYANQVLQDQFLGVVGPFPISSYWLNWNNDPSNPDNVNGMPGSDGTNVPWYSLDPAGYQLDDPSPNNRTMNPIFVMKQMLENLPGFLNNPDPQLAYTKLEMLIPRILLWDEGGYRSAMTNKDKWKHIYIPGNLNVMFDSGCVSLANVVFLKRRGMFLDSTSHRHNAAGKKEDSARIFYFPGCACLEDIREVLFNDYIFYTDCDQCGGGGAAGGIMNISNRGYGMCLKPCNFSPCGNDDSEGTPRYWFGGYNRTDGEYDNYDFNSCWTLARGLDFEGDPGPVMPEGGYYGWDDSAIDNGFPNCP